MYECNIIAWQNLTDSNFPNVTISPNAYCYTYTSELADTMTNRSPTIDL